MTIRQYTCLHTVLQTVFVTNNPHVCVLDTMAHASADAVSMCAIMAATFMKYLRCVSTLQWLCRMQCVV